MRPIKWSVNVLIWFIRKSRIVLVFKPLEMSVQDTTANSEQTFIFNYEGGCVQGMKGTLVKR